MKSIEITSLIEKKGTSTEVCGFPAKEYKHICKNGLAIKITESSAYIGGYNICGFSFYHTNGIMDESRPIESISMRSDLNNCSLDLVIFEIERLEEF